ncbi:MAG TPA: PilZ domain-containing protein [Candidatus Sulfotelmatobacter sp.]|nr:PilZ domain-containing protein [Candidatus Sulfotelmatobacter sp.]
MLPRFGFRILQREEVSMDLRSQPAPDYTTHTVDLRRHPRYKLEVDIRVYPHNGPVVRGRTADISESGISAILKIEVPVGEVVRLEFSLPLGDVEVHAMLRQRSAFRYGFQFVESSSAQDLIGRTCRQLAIEQAVGAE